MIFKPSALAVLLFLFSLSGFLSEAAAQRIDKRLHRNEGQDAPSPFRTQTDRERKQQEATIPASPLDTMLQPLEAPVDPNTYIVGPGDVFQISIWANTETAVQIPVNPEGALIIPTIGAIAVNGKTLAEVQKIVREEGAKKYLQSPVSANLVRVRQFRVHITGQVLNPGLYEALAVERVSDLIERAGGLTDWAAERAIEVRHRDGAVEIADLYQYKKLGKLEANLQLTGGDVVHVPPISLTKSTVRVEGFVREPGIYQLLENETLYDFLLRVEAFNKGADLQGAYIERKNESKGAAQIIPISANLENSGNGFIDFLLQDGDVIMVPTRKDEVYVIGAVNSPGAYPFYPNLRAIDYVGFAGANERAVKPSKFKIIRAGEKNARQGFDLPIQAGDTVVVPERAKFGVQEATTLIFTLTNIIVTLKAVGVIGN